MIGSPHSRSLLRISQLAAHLNCTPQTLRRSGIPCVRLPSGHRRYDLAAVRAFLGLKDDNANTKHTNLLIMARVSSKSQRDSLNNQVNVLKDECLKRYRRLPDLEFAHIRSGFDLSDKKFTNFIFRVINGEFSGSTLLIKDNTRPTRGAHSLFLYLCEEVGGLTVIETHPNENQNDDAQLMEDLMAVITVYSNRHSAKRGARLVRIDLTPHQLERAYRWYFEDSLSYAQIEERLAGELSENGKVVSENAIRRSLIDHHEKLALLYGKLEPKHSFSEFWKAKIRMKEGARLLRKDLMNSYEEYCKHKGKVCLSSRRCGEYIKQHCSVEFIMYHNVKMFKGIVIGEN